MKKGYEIMGSRIYNGLVQHYQKQMEAVNAELAAEFNKAEQMSSVTEAERLKKMALEKAQQQAHKIRDAFADQRREALRESAKYTFGAGESLKEGESPSERLFQEIEKAQALKTPAEIRKAYDTAEKYGDKVKLQALAARGLEGNMGDVVQRYAKHDPGFADRAGEYADLSRAMNAPGAKVRDSMSLGGVRKPYVVSKEMVEAGKDERGATIYRDQKVYSFQDPTPVDQGDQASHEAMANLAQVVRGRELHA